MGNPVSCFALTSGSFAGFLSPSCLGIYSLEIRILLLLLDSLPLKATMSPSANGTNGSNGSNGSADGAPTVEFTTWKGTKEGKVAKAQAHRVIKPRECLVEITHSGLCATDNHFKFVDMALGHEGVGVVKQVGPQVTQHKVYVSCPFVFLSHLLLPVFFFLTSDPFSPNSKFLGETNASRSQRRPRGLGLRARGVL